MTSTSPSLLLQEIVQTLYDKKAANILALDVRNVCSMTDYLIVAEGSVERHVKALADYLLERLQPLCGQPVRTEGMRFGDWVVLDYSEVVIHLFIPEMREYYALEKLWRQGNIVKVTIDTSQSQ